MKNKKISLFVLLIISVIGINILYKNKDSQPKPKSNLAIMIDENGNGNYTSASSIPKGSYALVEEKTVCENGGKVASYNNLTGQIGFSFLGSDRCSLYFEKVSSPTISNVLLNGSTLSASFNSKKSLCCYAITTSTSEPSDWTDISGSSYELNTSLNNSGTYYLWLKDAYGNVVNHEFTADLGTLITAVVVANNSDIFNENGIRYEGANPNNYICLDNKNEGNCSSDSLLFRIIGLFDEEILLDDNTTSETKKLVKLIASNPYDSGFYWNSTKSNNWSTSTLKSELNTTYLNELVGLSNVYAALLDKIVTAKWHLGSATKSNYQTLVTKGAYTQERNTSAIYNGNPSSVFAKVGLIYPSDYGYATDGGSTSYKTTCRNTALYNWGDSSYSNCKNNSWLFNNKLEWLISPYSNNSYTAAALWDTGRVDLVGYTVNGGPFKNSVRPTFYIDTENFRITGGTGTSSNPYHIG